MTGTKTNLELLGDGRRGYAKNLMMSHIKSVFAQMSSGQRVRMTGTIDMERRGDRDALFYYNDDYAGVITWRVQS